MRQKSVDFQYLEILQERTELTHQEQQQLLSCQKGYAGEINVDSLITQIIQDRFFVMDDLNIVFDNKRIQVDKLVQVGNRLYLIDMKNYHGHYVFHDRTWYYNQKPLTHSIFSQIERAHDILARLYAEQHLKIEITKVLVFTDPSAQIDIQGETGIVVKYLWEFCDWLQKICTGAVPNMQIPWQKYLQPFIAPPYRPDVDFSVETDRILLSGIVCPNCGSFKWQQYRYYLQCQGCGFSEAKETAYVRTICDYGVLFFHRNLKIGDLVEFFGEGYKKEYIRKMLAKHFDAMELKSKQFCYRNEGIQFCYWFMDKRDYFVKLLNRTSWKAR